MGSVTAEFEVRHRWRTTTLFSGRYALTTEHVHARSLQKLDLFDWHFRLSLHFACTYSSKYIVQRSAQRSRINVFSFFSTDWRWQWWRTSNSAVTASIAKRPGVAYSCSHVLLILLIGLLRSEMPEKTRGFAWGPRWALWKEPRSTDLTQVWPEAGKGFYESYLATGLTASHHAMTRWCLCMHIWSYWQSATKSPRQLVPRARSCMVTPLNLPNDLASNQALPALDTSHATCCHWRRLLGKGPGVY